MVHLYGSLLRLQYGICSLLVLHLPKSGQMLTVVKYLLVHLGARREGRLCEARTNP